MKQYEICKIENCDKKVHAKELCKKHYERQRLYGSPYVRTIADKNEIIIKDTHAEIIIYNNKCKEVARAIIDIDDVDKVKKYKWHFANKSKYLEAKKDKIKIRLHRYLLIAKDNEIVDHINHNVLDNRKSNLRICNYQQNAFNKALSKNNTSTYPGVTWHKIHKKWMASLQLNRKIVFLGYYKDFEEAKEARVKGELKYFREFSPCLSGVLL